MSKRKRRDNEPIEKEKTAVDDSPFRPTGGVLKKMDALDVDATAPGLPASLLDSMYIATDKGVIVYRKSAETLTPFVLFSSTATLNVSCEELSATMKTGHAARYLPGIIPWKYISGAPICIARLSPTLSL